MDHCRFYSQGKPKPKDSPILRDTGFSCQSVLRRHHPETMEDKQLTLIFPSLSWTDTHTHTHTHAWIPMSFHTNAKGYLLETYIPPASDDLQRWPFVSRIFFFLFLFASLPDFRGCPGQTVLSPRIRGGSDEDDDGNDEITTLTWLASTTALSRTESRSGLPPWASSFQVYWRCTWLAFIHLANGLSRCAVQAGGRLGGRSRGERGLVCC